jgi:monoamine oxidase
MPEILLSCKKDSPGPEVKYSGTVAVIGAGAAGLYAADLLRSKGIKVVVLEAGPRAGGRMRSFKTSDVPSDSLLFDPNNLSIADFPLELGAEVVYGSDSTWGTILNDLTVGTFDLSGATNEFILDSTVKSGSDWGADPDYAAVQNFVVTLPTLSGSGVSIKTAANVSDRGQALLNSQAGNWYGSSSDRIDAGALGSGLKQIKHNGKWVTLVANQMQDVLISRFSQTIPYVKLNTPVQAIDYSSDTTINITTGTGTVTANKVIVAVPLSILKTGSIAFTPGLPSAMTGSMAKFGTDDCIRVFLDFKKNFWGLNTGFIWGGSTAPQYFNSGVGRSKQFTTLSITVCGPAATSLSGLGASMVNAIVAELDSIYYDSDGGFATRYIRRDLTTNDMLYTIQDWSKETYIKGGFSYPMVGATADDRTAIGQSIGGKLFFAGEATDVSGDAGTINGAMASAERVVQEVVTSIISP